MRWLHGKNGMGLCGEGVIQLVNTTIDSLGYPEVGGASDVFFKPSHALFAGEFFFSEKGGIGKNKILIKGYILRNFGRKMMPV